MADNYDFWETLLREASLSRNTNGMDIHLASHELEGSDFTSVRTLTDKHREATGLMLPVEAGTRVAFRGSLGAYLSAESTPEPGTKGSVVTVKSANGEVTDHDGMVFVNWDDGVFRAVHASFLEYSSGTARRGSPNRQRIRVASLGDLTDFLKVSDDTLVHRSSRDLWSLKKDGESYVIERLFDSTGDPLKV